LLTFKTYLKILIFAINVEARLRLSNQYMNFSLHKQRKHYHKIVITLTEPIREFSVLFWSQRNVCHNVRNNSDPRQPTVGSQTPPLFDEYSTRSCLLSALENGDSMFL
jgi:hypothetical protein